MYLQHAFNLSDEAVVAQWVENRYYQHFIGKTFFQRYPPIDPSSMSRWRKRIGNEGVEWFLTKPIETTRNSGAATDKSLKRASVDTTVMEMNIAHPTDARLNDGGRRQLVALAGETGLTLQQNCNRLEPRLARRRSAIEPEIGHMTTDGRLARWSDQGAVRRCHLCRPVRIPNCRWKNGFTG